MTAKSWISTADESIFKQRITLNISSSARKAIYEIVFNRLETQLWPMITVNSMYIVYDDT